MNEEKSWPTKFLGFEMGHGAAKHSKNYMTKEENRFLDIASSGCAPKEPKESNYQCEESNDENILVEIQNAVSWPSKAAREQGMNLKRSIRLLFEKATKEMTDLAQQMKYNQVEEISQALIQLASLWGDEFLCSLDLKSFIREIITLEVKGVDYVVQAGEFFKSEPFYSDDERLLKLYYFHVKELSNKNRIMSYYLECSNILQPFFLLGLHVSGTHLKVETYDRTCPSYWIVREAVLRDMRTRINANLLVKRDTKQSAGNVNDQREGIQV